MLRCIGEDEAIGYVYRKYVRFVLSFEDKKYIVVNDDDDYVIIRVKWCPYGGFVRCDDEITYDAISIAKKLIELHTDNEASYPLNGEWYFARLVQSEHGTRLNIKLLKKRRTTTIRTVIPLMLKFLFALFAGALALLVYSAELRQWMYFLFSSLDMRGILLSAVGIELIGITVLFVVFSERRGPVNLLLNSLVPIGAVAICALLKCYWWMWIAIPSCILAIFLLFKLYAVIIERPRSLRLFFDGLRRASVLLAAIFLSASSIWNLTTVRRPASSVNVDTVSSDELAEYHSTVCLKLEKETWNGLTLQEKLDVLQVICDHECDAVLGCGRVEIVSGLTRNSSVLGSYNNELRSFVINEEHLKSADVELVLDTVLHEIRHAYQYRMAEMYASLSGYIDDEYIELYPFRQAREFTDGFDNYYSGDESFERYYYQDVEEDSRAWAKKRFNEYYIAYVYPDR